MSANQSLPTYQSLLSGLSDVGGLVTPVYDWSR